MWIRPGPCVSCAIALGLAASLPGCAVGFQRASAPPRQAAPSAALDWERVTIVSSERGALVAGLERVLGERGVREISFAKVPPAARDGTIVEIADGSDESFLSFVSLMLSLFTLSAVPGYAASDHHVVLTLHRPGAVPRTFDYRYRESIVIWLPLALFGPDFVVGLNGGWQREDPLTTVGLEIARRFADDAAGLAPVASPPPAGHFPGS